MAYYRLTITRIEDNPDFEKEIKEFESQNRYRGDMMGMPQKEVNRNELNVIINEVALNNIKAAAIQGME